MTCIASRRNACRKALTDGFDNVSRDLARGIVLMTEMCDRRRDGIVFIKATCAGWNVECDGRTAGQMWSAMVEAGSHRRPRIMRVKGQSVLGMK